MTSNTAPLKFGTSSRGGFIGVKVTNCYFYDSPMGAIKLQLVDGGRLEDVEISRITMENVGNPIFIRLGNRGNTYGDDGPAKAPVGVLRNVRIHDVVAEVTAGEKKTSSYQRQIRGRSAEEQRQREQSNAGPIMITGIPGHFVENVELKNVRISFPGGGTAEDAAREVPEDEDRYPEQFFFGPLPAWGAYVRHARDIRFTNVELTLRGEDARERLVLDDVEGFVER